MRNLIFVALISLIPIISFSQIYFNDNVTKYHRDDDISRDSVIELFFDKLNAQRIENGSDSIMHIEYMDTTARNHSLKMVKSDSVYHTDLRGRFGYNVECVQVIEAIWYQNANFLADYILTKWSWDVDHLRALNLKNCYAGLDFAINKQDQKIYITYNAICLGN